MNYLDKVFLWIGCTSKNQIEFDNYFKIDYSEEDTPVICGFCKDIEKEWYDEDFIGYIKYNEYKAIENLLESVPVDRNQFDTIKKICLNLGVASANAVYWYSGEINTPSPNKLYNELFYIGEFDLD